jgi:hypothetical protein
MTFLLNIWSEFLSLTNSVRGFMPASTEFWSGIIGAIVGGGISYCGQLKVLRETRIQRRDDHLRVQQALGHALLFKLIRIYSNFSIIHRHIENCFEDAAKRGLPGEPWQFVLPLAALAEPVHFSPDEMAMLLGLKNNDVFNMVVSLDANHNHLIEATRLMGVERRALTQTLNADKVEGATISGTTDRNAYLALRPKMIEVTSLIEHIRRDAKRDTDESFAVLQRLNDVLKQKLGLTYRIENLHPTPDAATHQEARQ